MESASKSHQHGVDINRFMQSASSNFFSLFDLNSIKSSNDSKTTTSTTSHHLRISPSSSSSSSSTIRVPLLFGDAATPPPLPQPPSQSLPSVIAPSVTSLSSTSSLQSNQSDSLFSTPASSSEIKGMSSGSGFPSTVRIAGLNSDAKGGGPAFVGQVFSMCDLSGTGLMAVSTRIDIPFLSKRTPEWIKKVFSKVIKNENNGPVFRFSWTWVMQEKPHMFQFVPNKKQVKAANKLLKELPKNNGRKKVDGVPVFTAQNLDIAIATSDGIKWYTPYFFDKNMLDNILEESIDQHFHTLIHSRHVQRRRDVIDDNFTAEVVEENGESIWEPPEVQEVLEEMGNPGIPLSVISKAAEMQLLYTVDKVLLGNRWLRKATGIQPKFPYMVDSFEERSAASFLRAADSTSTATISDTGCDGNDHEWQLGSSELDLKERNRCSHAQSKSNWDFRFPFGDWLSNPWLKEHKKAQTKSDTRFEDLGRDSMNPVPQLNPLLPKITMVGISTGEAGQMNRANLKKTMEELTRELENTGQENNGSSSELKHKDRDPLFVANVGDYYSSIAKTGSARWVRGRNN